MELLLNQRQYRSEAGLSGLSCAFAQLHVPLCDMLPGRLNAGSCWRSHMWPSVPATTAFSGQSGCLVHRVEPHIRVSYRRGGPVSWHQDGSKFACRHGRAVARDLSVHTRRTAGDATEASGALVGTCGSGPPARTACNPASPRERKFEKRVAA